MGNCVHFGQCSLKLARRDGSFCVVDVNAESLVQLAAHALKLICRARTFACVPVWRNDKGLTDMLCINVCTCS